MLRRVLAFVLAGATGACALVAGINGYEDAPPGPADDAAPDEGAALDADAAPASDAAVDARFCALHAGATFCDDFEGDAAITSGLDGRATAGAGVTRDTTLVYAGGASALMLLGGNTLPCAYADLGTSLDGGFSEAHVELQMRSGFADGGPMRGGVFTLDHGAKNAECFYAFEVDGDTAGILLQHNLADGGQINRMFPLSTAPLAGAWAHVEVDLTTQLGVPALAVRVEGKPALTLTRNDEPVLAECAFTGGLTFTFGLFCNNQSTAEVRIDNVLLERR